MKRPEGLARISNASAYTGTVPPFEKQGFAWVARRPQGKQRMRKALTAPRKRIR
ncbi:hypothetical protein HUW62_43845 [Myxococcus sp. AM011]|uniref:hypothetical protein n=1 Tax=Myxococcus sp. AM011 TaxID=2745200 RepID=UPI001596005B|nr:hypothetical protein [Myxococcus sp. AM011]NVJ28162.1 hypothetical protein [Myxococcus sp. AM011]